MTIKFSSSKLVNAINAIPGKPSMERSKQILKLLLNEARTIDDTAPIVKMLEKDIAESTRGTSGHSMGLNLASGMSNDALVAYLMVPLGGTGKRGRSLEFTCRQFGYAVSEKLSKSFPFRALSNGTISVVAQGLFYSKARGDSDLGSSNKRIAASLVSAELVNLGLTCVAKTSLDEISKLVCAKEKGDVGKYKYNEIMNVLIAKSKTQQA